MEELSFIGLRVPISDRTLLEDSAARYRMDLSNFIRMVLFSNLDRTNKALLGDDREWNSKEDVNRNDEQ